MVNILLFLARFPKLSPSVASKNQAERAIVEAVRNDAIVKKRKPRRSAGALLGWPRLLQRLEPVVHILVDLILGKAVTLLQLALQLFATAFDHIEIVVGKFAPFFLGGTLELLPVAFNPVPVHPSSPFLN